MNITTETVYKKKTGTLVKTKGQGVREVDLVP